ncbi:acyltransferase [Flavobacterium sp. AJR]|uniref:acyltransferase n=1 Tax=Flavobacterium sp. AJR TaxID=1979369 RepID=UPI000F507FC0|nr:acyltransferase [Flavobacterium sp. AJR]
MKDRISYERRPTFNQDFICSGQGIVKIGKNCSFGYKLGGFHKRGGIELQARYENSFISIGDNVATNNNVFLLSANYIEIGDNSLIGQNVTIMDHEAHNIDPFKRREIGEKGKIIVGKNVWIGNNVVILKNTEIGENTIVGTGAVVSGKFPSNVIIGGVPAKIIRNI